MMSVLRNLTAMGTTTIRGCCMSGFFPRRSNLLATAIAVVGFGALGFASIGFGAVIVGETRRIDLGTKAAAGNDPVSEGKSLHAREGRARQEALFRYADIGDVSAILCKLSQPGLRLG